MDWLTIADHSITDIMRRNFPDLTVTLLAFVVMLSDANLTKTSPPLCIGQCSVNIRPNFGQRSVNLRLNSGRKGGEEAGCLVDESCLEARREPTEWLLQVEPLGFGERRLVRPPSTLPGKRSAYARAWLSRSNSFRGCLERRSRSLQERYQHGSCVR